MHIELIKHEKNHCEVKMNNPTIAEILRVYLYEAGADFAAWRREHPSRPLIFTIKSSDKSVKKVVSDAVAAIEKECNKILTALKK